MRNLALLTLLLIFASCRSTNLHIRHEAEQCSPVFVYVDESKKLIDADQSYCNVRGYEFGINHVGPLQGTELKKDIHYCDRCVGFKKYTDVATFWDKVRRIIVNESAEP